MKISEGWNRIIKKTAASVLILGIGLATSIGAATPSKREVVLSPVYKIDKKYKSMEGPQSTQPVYLLKSPTPELLWITGFKTEMVGADGTTPTLPEFMCHVNLDYDTARHAQLFGGSSGMNARLLTLSQGQVTTQFPEGFGIPILSNEPISMTTQVLNFNLEHPDMQVRHKVTFEFVRDQDVKDPMKPLFNTSGFGMALLEGHEGHYGMADGDDSTHGPSCLPGVSAPNANGGSLYQDAFNHKFTGHWVIKPGREVNQTNVTKYLALPYDTTLHYAAVHLHPFAESLELRDLTTHKRIFKSKARGFKDKIGLIYVDSFASQKGIPLYKDHEYDLISTYNNTTQINQDSMAVMLLFLLDKRFQKPSASALASMVTPVVAPVAAGQTENSKPASDAWHPRLVLHTTGGDLLAELYPDAAPQTVAQISKLVKAGAFDTTPFYRLEPGFVLQTANIQNRSLPLSPEQQAMIKKIPGEFSPTLKHVRGVLSMAHADNDPDSAESSFSILLNNAPHLDGKYAIFGKLTEGWEVLKGLEAATINASHQPQVRIEIRKAELIETPQQLAQVKLAGRKALPKSPVQQQL